MISPRSGRRAKGGTMRRLLFAIALAILPATVHAQACVGAPGGGRVRLATDILGVRSTAGEVAITVYPDDRHRFLAKGGKLVRARVAAMRPASRTCFWLPPGIYAVAVYHDENGDHDFNHTLWMPKEGFGLSNDAPTSIGLPSLADARFTLPGGGRTLQIKMRYP